MLWYLMKYKPFGDLSGNLLQIYNELIVALMYLALLIINLWKISGPPAEYIGWALIGLISASLFATWVLLLPGAINSLIKGFCRLIGRNQAADDVIVAKDSKTDSNTDKPAITSSIEISAEIAKDTNNEPKNERDNNSFLNEDRKFPGKARSMSIGTVLEENLTHSLRTSTKSNIILESI